MLESSTAGTRIETDSLGARQVPKDALYGINTLRGCENFEISPLKIGSEPALIRALAEIKRAAAATNLALGVLDKSRAEAIIAACEEVIDGSHHRHFLVDLLEGSGGTSINMNANEVIANRALQLLGHEPGDYQHLHPNDHVNMGQSTNDVVPSAVKLAVHEKSAALVASLTKLGDALEAKAHEFSGVLKIGRTCMQAAQPMTLGQEFGGYAAAIHRVGKKAADVVEDLLTLPLGGTAIGTGLGAAPGFGEGVYKQLAAGLNKPVRPAADLFDGMQNADSFARVSSEFRIAAEVIGKISLDLIILSSGTKSGIGEIRLPAVQPGSSIMPGKVNPVLPMMMQQLTYAGCRQRRGGLAGGTWRPAGNQSLRAGDRVAPVRYDGPFDPRQRDICRKVRRGHCRKRGTGAGQPARFKRPGDRVRSVARICESQRDRQERCRASKVVLNPN